MLRRWPEALAALLALLLWLAPLPARADGSGNEVSALRFERADDGLQLSTVVRFELTPVVEDALLKGVPMFFVAEAELKRERWYWYDKKIASAARHMRLAYQPLTRRWRLNVAQGATLSTGLGTSLGQSFDTLTEALATLQRVSSWRIADLSELDSEAKYNVEFRFKLDVSQLPRPFQIGAVGQADWALSFGRTQRLVLENWK